VTTLRRLLDSDPPRQADELRTLWQNVLALLDSVEARTLGAIHVGKVGEPPTPWAQTNAGEDLVNLTLELKPHQLELNVVGWKEAQAAALKDWLQSVEGEDAIQALDGYSVVAFRRRAYKKSDQAKPWWQQEDVEEVDARDAAAFDAGWVTRCVLGLGKSTEEKAAFHVRRAWPADEVRSLGADLPAAVAAEVRRVLPVLDRIRTRSASRA
jgi:hypothetical protein